MNLKDLTTSQLQKIIVLKKKMEKLQSKLDKLTGGGNEVPSPFRLKVGKKRRMSAAGRRAIAAAVKRRWAKYKGKAKASKPGKRRKMSAAARRKMAEVAKARWAKAKAAGKTTL